MTKNSIAFQSIVKSVVWSSPRSSHWKWWRCSDLAKWFLHSTSLSSLSSMMNDILIFECHWLHSPFNSSRCQQFPIVASKRKNFDVKTFSFSSFLCDVFLRFFVRAHRPLITFDGKSNENRIEKEKLFCHDAQRWHSFSQMKMTIRQKNITQSNGKMYKQK